MDRKFARRTAGVTMKLDASTESKSALRKRDKIKMFLGFGKKNN
jgi:hypothetical protein